MVRGTYRRREPNVAEIPDVHPALPSPAAQADKLGDLRANQESLQAVSICWHSECRGDAEPGSTTSLVARHTHDARDAPETPRLSCRGTTSSNPSPSSRESANDSF